MSNINFDDIKTYYSNLLIYQYRNKPKAKATIELLVKELVENTLIFDIERTFDVETAIGKQLDIIGKYVGVSRAQYKKFGDITKYFSVNDINENILNWSQNGFNDFINDISLWKEEKFLDYNNQNENYFLDDIQLRYLIKFKIIFNNNVFSIKNIIENLYNYFKTDILIFDNYNMTMIVLLNNQVKELLNIILYNNIFPIPDAIKVYFFNVPNNKKIFGFMDVSYFFSNSILTDPENNILTDQNNNILTDTYLDIQQLDRTNSIIFGFNDINIDITLWNEGSFLNYNN